MNSSNKSVLITGAAGFIGSHLTELCVEKGYNVIGYGHPTTDFNPVLNDIVYIEGDFRDRKELKKALEMADIIFHFGGITGFGHLLSDYVSSNILGLTNILDIINEEKLKIRKIIFASSSAVYGEGEYHCPNHGVLYPKCRKIDSLKNKEWEYCCDICSSNIFPSATKESKPLTNQHIYAITKKTCENILNEFSKMHDIIVITLRYSILYGQYQNKGIIPLFIKKMQDSEEIQLHEDGCQIRDFIYLEDAAEISLKVMSKVMVSDTLNVSSSQPTSINLLIDTISDISKLTARSKVLNNYRDGDIRHIYLDNHKLLNFIDYSFTDLRTGLKNMNGNLYG